MLEHDYTSGPGPALRLGASRVWITIGSYAYVALRMLNVVRSICQLPNDHCVRAGYLRIADTSEGTRFTRGICLKMRRGHEETIARSLLPPSTNRFQSEHVITSPPATMVRSLVSYCYRVRSPSLPRDFRRK